MKAALLLLLLLGLRAAAAEAGAVVTDGSVVRVSADEPNLIEAADGKVSAFVFAQDAFEASSDAEAGVVYFQPRQEGARSGFVETIDGQGKRRRISLVLVAQRDFPAQRVRIAPAGGRADSNPDAPARPPANLDLPRNRRIKIMLRELAGAAAGRDFAPAPVGPPRMLGDGIEMTMVALQPAGDWQLQTALLANPGAEAVGLRPAELMSGNRRIVAVASDVDSIAGGGRATVYLVLAAPGQGI